MDYMRQLRRMVGNFPLVMVGAGVLVLDAQGRLLLLRRTDNECWGIPGGALEPGETLEVTARRETLEETGLHLPSLEIFGVFSGSEFYYQYPNGDQVHNVSVITGPGMLWRDHPEHRRTLCLAVL
jgi:ADP-ribose pyrophosphatase YjhB (NUDIX family)